MKKKRLLKDKKQETKSFKPPIFRIFLWFALGTIILAVSTPRVLSSGNIEWAPVAGVLLGFFGVGMGLAQIIYFVRRT
ncbi:hypothetical protein C9439_06280 [archaeon SCG-AAA382B04]|nr:hypothetical protein C9439_06280 [archaeon SCG-AAA382B04]